MGWTTNLNWWTYRISEPIMKQQTLGTLEFPGKQKSSNSASQNSAQRACRQPDVEGLVFQQRDMEVSGKSRKWKFTLQGDDHIENHWLKSANWWGICDCWLFPGNDFWAFLKSSYKCLSVPLKWSFLMILENNIVYRSIFMSSPGHSAFWWFCFDSSRCTNMPRVFWSTGKSSKK